MGESQGWKSRRYFTLLIVVALHGALVTALLMQIPAKPVAGSAPRPVDLLLFRATPPARIVPENFRPQRIRGDTALSITPPVLGSLPPAVPEAPAGAGRGSDGNGSGVDWGAEARRALNAFEIRRKEPGTHSMQSETPAEEGWWPQAQHHAGEEYKTETGDWIVWIDSNCYQIAAAATPYALGASLPRTICPGKDDHTTR
jgi:hypothetical protein